MFIKKYNFYQTDKNLNKIPLINGLRGISIFLVLYHHLFGWYTKAGWSSFTFLGKQIPLNVYLSNGWHGVNVFFFLSGFVLYLPYAIGKRDFKSMEDLSIYYKSRINRLYPLYIFVFILSLIFCYPQSIKAKDFFKLLMHMPFATFTFSSIHFAPKNNPVLWSLGVEIWFSFLFPIFSLLFKKNLGLSILVISSFLSIIIRYIGYVKFHTNPLFLNMLSDGLLGRLPDFLFGMAIVEIYLKVDSYNFLKQYRYAFLSILLITFSFACWDIWFINERINCYIPAIANIPFNLGLSLLVIFLLKSKNRFTTFLENRYLQTMGISCYSVYMWHYIIMDKMLSSGNIYIYSRYFIFYLLLLYVISTISFIFLESKNVILK